MPGEGIDEIVGALEPFAVVVAHSDTICCLVLYMTISPFQRITSLNLDLSCARGRIVLQIKAEIYNLLIFIGNMIFLAKPCVLMTC